MRLGIVAIATVLVASQAHAADLLVAPGKTYVIERPDRAPRPVIRHRHRWYVWKRIGYPCLLTPDQVVRRNWNGPQCRWVDNM
jgi:hypothetical protein